MGYLRCFGELFGLSPTKVSEIAPGGQKAILSFLMDEFLEPNLEDPDQMMFRRRAFVFCLTAGFIFNRDPGFGDLELCPLVQQMEQGHCTGALVLAETIRSLDRTALGFEEWTVSPVFLQVHFLKPSLFLSFFCLHPLIEKINQQIWLKDHLRIIAPPVGPKYNPSNYRMRRNLISLKSVDAWSYWMLELGSDDILWYVPWYQMEGVLQTSYNESRVIFLDSLTALGIQLTE